MNRYIHDFPGRLTGVEFHTLEHDPHSIYALSEQLKLIYLNPGWFRFALENQGEPDISTRFPIGTDITCAISGPLRDYYTDLFRKVLQSGASWEHDYECSSPEKYRVFHETVYRMHNKSGLIVMNSLLIEEEHDKPDSNNVPPIEKNYRQKNGMITQCAYCRRFERVAEPDIWDWIPDWVRQVPKEVRHSLCDICYDYYFKHQETSPLRN